MANFKLPNLRIFGNPIYDTTLIFIVSSTIASLFFYDGEIDRSEANIIISLGAVTTTLYYFLAYKTKK